MIQPLASLSAGSGGPGDSQALPALPSHAPPAPPTFDAIPLSPDVRKAIDELGYVNPTPVAVADTCIVIAFPFVGNGALCTA